jgi:hypothetical protein
LGLLSGHRRLNQLLTQVATYEWLKLSARY